MYSVFPNVKNGASGSRYEDKTNAGATTVETPSPLFADRHTPRAQKTVPNIYAASPNLRIGFLQLSVMDFPLFHS